MHPRSLRRVVVVLVVGLGVSLGHAEIVNRIVATIDGEPITAHELQDYVAERRMRDASRKTQLDALITDRLLEKEIKAKGIVARDDEIARYMEEIRARNGMDEEQFRQALTAQGYSYDAYREKVKLEIEKVQLVNREIRSRVNVSPQEVQRYYDAHLDDYETSPQIQVQDIFFPFDPLGGVADATRTRAKAEEVREMAVNGRNFGDLARQFSEGPGAEAGGELGTFSRGEMDHALDSAAFALEPGEVSEPIVTASGIHVLRVEKRVAAGHQPREEVEEEIRERLYDKALEDRFESWLSRDLRERHHVKVFD